MPKIAPKLASKPSSMTAPTPTPNGAPAPSPARPPLPAPAPAAATTTTTQTNEPAWLTGTAFKAANEHTFATQRAKKAADRAKGKAHPRKASRTSPSAAAAASATSTTSMTSSTMTMASIWAEVWDAREDMDWPELPMLPRWTPASPASPATTPSECIGGALRPTQDREVPLAALVRTVKARGAKKDGEFEFLPPVKNVIALDDAESNVPDEPWEYVSSVGGEDEARKIFSYAEIVSKSA